MLKIIEHQTYVFSKPKQFLSHTQKLMAQLNRVMWYKILLPHSLWNYFVFHNVAYQGLGNCYEQDLQLKWKERDYEVITQTQIGFLPLFAKFQNMLIYSKLY